MEEFYLVSEVGPLVAKMKGWSMKVEVVDKEKKLVIRKNQLSRKNCLRM